MKIVSAMSRHGLAATLLLAAALPACAQQPSAAQTEAKSTNSTSRAQAQPDVKAEGSYSLGVSMGEQLRQLGLTGDSIAAERLAQGVKDALAGQAQMGPDEQERVLTLLQEARTAAAAPNREAARKFLEENGKRKGVVTTDSGLQYRIVEEGKGQSPEPNDVVTVHYRGTLLDGTEFDSSIARGQPVTFPVNGVIPGWQEALVMMKPGAKWQLFIPPALAYDLDSPAPVIPPGSMLIFDVELLSVQQNAGPQPAPMQ